MFRTTFEKNIESATSHLLLEPDWTTILLICDDINQKDVSPKIAFNIIKKKISSPNPHSAYYALLVLESVVKNCGAPMHDEVFTRENCEMFSSLLEQKTHENVRQKILELVQTWAYAFRSTEKYQAVKDTMTILKANGHTFPELVEADAMFTADTAPNWADGNVCHRCRTTFSVMNRKHHCRNCGQVFCGLCSRMQCPLPKFGIEKEVRVCDGCFIALQRPSTAKSSARSAETDLPAEYLNSSLAQQVQTPSRKTEQELEEEEELQLALALSQSEAEQKKQQQLKQQQLQSSAAPYRIQQRSPSPEAPPAPKELLQQEPENPDLAKYLNRNFWEQRKISDSPMNSPSAPSPMPTPQPQTTLHDKPTDEVQIDEFAAHMRSQVEIFVNRMKSNSSRGRSIANDSSVQTLFMNLTSLHSDQLSYIKEMDDKRMWYEQLQDKLVQIKDSRAALDVLRQEHVEKLRQMAEEQERQRQNQMAQKLEIMRKKKQEYLQYQRQLALQRIQEQEREMQMRQEQQKAQYRMGQTGFPYMTPAGVGPAYNPYAYIPNSPGRMPSAQFNSQGQQVANALPPGMYAAAGMAAPNQNQHQTMLMHGQINPNAVMPPAVPNGGQMLNSSVIQQPGLPQPQPHQMGENTMQQNPPPGLNVGPPQQQQQQQQQQLHALHQMPQVMHLPHQSVVHGQPPPQMPPQVGTAAVAPLANQQIQAVAAAPAPPQQDPEPPAAAAAVAKPEPATAELISFD